MQTAQKLFHDCDFINIVEEEIIEGQGQMYHIAPVTVRDYIQKQGLIAQEPSIEKWGYSVESQPLGVYLLSEEFDTHDWAELTSAIEVDIWEINVDGLTIRPDYMIGLTSYRVNENISSNRLKRIGTHESGQRQVEKSWFKESKTVRYGNRSVE